MAHQTHCTECGADWSYGQTCENHFNQMLYWEQEDPSVYGAAHHLMVLSFHLQHPSRYSPEGLAHAKGLLLDFLERGVTPAQALQRDHDAVDSGKRKFKITGTPERHGSYAYPVAWTITASDMVASGQEAFVGNVHVWARSILNALRASGNLTAT